MFANLVKSYNTFLGFKTMSITKINILILFYSQNIEWRINYCTLVVVCDCTIVTDSEYNSVSHCYRGLSG